jgi:hypothetical protein
MSVPTPGESRHDDGRRRSARNPASYADPLNQEHKECLNQDNQDPASRQPIPWRPIGAAATSIGAPAGLWLLHPALGVAVFLTELAVSLIILGTALFGAKEYSERAFRLLRWIADRPEPDAPPDNTAGQVIDLVALPDSCADDPHRAVKAEVVLVTSSQDGERELPEPDEHGDATDLRQLTAGT